MVTINSNGVSFSAGRSINITGNNITVTQRNGRTYVNGKDITDLATEDAPDGILKITVESGTLVSLESDVAVEAQDVTGNVSGGNSVTCRNVNGDVRAGNSVNCGNVGGSVKAGNSVNHR